MTLTEKQQEAWDVFQKHNNQAAAAKELGISRRAFRDRFDSAKSKIYQTPVGFKTTKIATDENGTIRAMSHKLAPEIDADPLRNSGKIVRRSTLYGADGAVTGEWVIRQPEDEAKSDYITALHNSFSQTVIPSYAPTVLSKNRQESDLALFMSIDEHIGVKLCAEQVGTAYGLDQSVALMEEKFRVIVDRTPATKHCLYVNLGDQFHANDHMDVTPASKNPLFSDSSFNTVSDAVILLNRKRIDILLEKFEYVKIRGVAGNHDYDPMGWLFRCFDIAYEKEHRVDTKFWGSELGVEKFGVNFLGFAHGHMMKPDAMAGACADRFPKIYGDTKMRYLHTGHYHNDKVADLWGGFKFHSHRTMSPKDWYSFRHGYLSRQSMSAFIYNRDEGEVAKFTTSLI